VIESWAQWLRHHIDKFLLLVLVLVMLGVVLHVSHDQADKDLLHWAREMTGTVLGALIGLITGELRAQAKAAPTVPAEHPAPPA
jgi:hypothetical protein